MTRIRILALLALVGLLVLWPAVAFAQPNAHRFYGTATLDGAAVSVGSGVVASVGGDTYLTTTTDALGSYVITVASTDITKSYAGQTVSFSVRGYAAPQTATWQAGGVTNVNLTALSAPPAPAAITLSPASGLAATTISGSNYTAGSRVTVTWAFSAVATVPATVTVEGTGVFTALIAVPTATPGSYTVRAVDAAGKSAEANFTVLALPAGVQGPAGIQGPAGTAGAKGDTGVAGPKGDTGATGPAGAPGATGSKGDTGSTGPKGDTGATGPAGAPGATGSKGDTGATGSKGDTGATGSKGDTGATGPKGDQGVAGPQGLAGVAGAVGPTGPAGAIGPRGPEGPAGKDAPTAIVWIGLILAVVAIIMGAIAVMRKPKAL